jgi:hypothetical protein
MERTVNEISFTELESAFEEGIIASYEEFLSFSIFMLWLDEDDSLEKVMKNY